MTDQPVTPSDKPWTETFNLQGDVLGYVQNRGLAAKTPAEAFVATVEAHRAAEAKLGVPADQLLRLPKDVNDTATRDAMFKRLGRPDSPAGYDLKSVGADDDFASFFAPAAHTRGLTKEQAEGVAKDINAHIAKTEADEVKAKAAQYTAQKQELQNEWGANAVQNLALAQKAYRAFGLSDEMISAMEVALGPKALMNKFMEMGRSMGEHAFVENNSPSTFGVSKEAAAVRIKELKSDKEWTKKWLGGDLKAKREFDDLNAIALA